MPDGVTLTPVTGDPFNGGAQYQLTPVDGDPFQQNIALTDYARTLSATQPPIGQPGGAPLDDFAPAPVSAAAPQPTFPGLAGVAGDPSRSLAVRLPAAIGSSLADQGRGLVQSAWGAATLPGDVARGLVDPNSPEAIRRSTDLAGLLTLPNGAEPQLAPEVMAPRAGENISSAAIKAADGRIFTGHTHADAYEQAMKAGIDIADIDAVGFDGFLTSSGRYVDRPTALRIASSQQQFAPEEGQYGLRAEQLGQKSLAGTATDSGNTMYAGGEGGRPLALAELAAQRDQAIPIPSSPGGPQLSLTPAEASNHANGVHLTPVEGNPFDVVYGGNISSRSTGKTFP